MIDQGKNWIGILSVREARADLVANQVDLAWITKSPLLIKSQKIEVKNS